MSLRMHSKNWSNMSGQERTRSILFVYLPIVMMFVNIAMIIFFEDLKGIAYIVSNIIALIIFLHVILLDHDITTTPGCLIPALTYCAAVFFILPSLICVEVSLIKDGHAPMIIHLLKAVLITIAVFAVLILLKFLLSP